MSESTPLYTREYWAKRLSEFVPAFIADHEVLCDIDAVPAVVFHGSMATGDGDRLSDLDVWLLYPDEVAAVVAERAGTTFFSFVCDGVEGHMNSEPVGAFHQRLQSCDMDLIYQLRRCAILSDSNDMAESLVAQARQPMRRAVRNAFFFYHYVEMRGDHRACDNPLERGDSIAMLHLLPKVTGHALRAALILDAEPYPYDKWIAKAAGEKPVGRIVLAGVERIMEMVSSGGLLQPGPQDDHPITLELRAIRQTLIDTADERCVYGEWLRRWWHSIDEARTATRSLNWSHDTRETAG
jgi:hypothetical protein